MTHPFHPLHGRTLEVVDRRRCQDGEYLYLAVDTRVERLPAAWTSLGCPDPLVVFAAGRALLRADDLARLADMLVEIAGGEPTSSDGKSPGDV